MNVKILIKDILEFLPTWGEGLLNLKSFVSLKPKTQWTLSPEVYTGICIIVVYALFSNAVWEYCRTSSGWLASERNERESGSRSLYFSSTIRFLFCCIIVIDLRIYVHSFIWAWWLGFYCGFCLSRILLNFHMYVCQSVSHRCNISAFLHVWRAITQIQFGLNSQINLLMCYIF